MKSTLTTKEDRKATLKLLKSQLSALQQPLRQAKIPVIILLEGFSASGKGDLIAQLISQLDPRGYSVHTSPAITEAEARLPLLAPFWQKLPPQGEMAILEGSWYSRILALPKKQQEAALEAALVFERQLVDDGYLILKCFLTVEQEEQSKRLHKLAQNPATTWRVTKKDWKQNKHYEEDWQKASKMMAQTNPDYSPWMVVDGTHPTMAAIQLLDTVTQLIDSSIAQGTTPTPAQVESNFLLQPIPLLSEVSLHQTITDEDYKAQLKVEKSALQQLHSQLYQKKIPVVLAFEGWDAAGKGGAIRRLSWALDPRGYDVIPIASPSKEELARHYLWRFWTKLPKDGHIAIFDRTWYGRVMVERLEGFTPEDRWSRGYEEINEFEAELSRWGAVVIKFWIQIDKDEQLRRFTDRQNTPEKQYKLTDEDWRNREKWAVYESAIDEMLQKTNTAQAPWVIVEGNDKKYARLKVLRTLREALEERLGDTK